MKVELHLHTDRYSPCAVSPPEELLGTAVEAGYGAVFITEHDAVWNDVELAHLQAQFPEVRIFPGMELMVPQMNLAQHLLVLGTNDPTYVHLADRPDELLARARDRGHLTVLAHPYRYAGGDELLRQGLLPDAIEHRTNNQRGEQSADARRTAERLGLPLVNAGDTHAPTFLDRYWIETEEAVETAKELRFAVLSGAYVLRTARNEPSKVATAR